MADVVISAGMCLAVERRISTPALGGANYEDVIIATDSGAEILTGTADINSS